MSLIFVNYKFMATPKQETKPGFWTKVRPFELQRAYIVFAVIYFPIALLFINRGVIAEVLLIIYTLVMMAVGMGMIVKFLLYLAKAANEHNGSYGSLLIVYIFNALVPLFMFKIYGFVFVRLLPDYHRGWLCDIKYFIVDVLHLFQFQHTLNILIMVSLAVFVGVAVWAVGKK